MKPDLISFVSGWCAASTNILITFPIQKVVFRQIIEMSNSGPAIQQMKREGVCFLYRGMLSPLCQKSISISIMFGMYGNTYKYFRNLGFKHYKSTMTAGLLTGTTETFLMPFERIQGLLVNSKFNLTYKNMFHAFRVIWNDYGIGQFYNAMSLVWIRNVTGNVGFFTAKHEVDRKVKDKLKSPVWISVVHFFGGALVGAAMSSLLYPLTATKLLMHSRLCDNSSMIRVMLEIYRSGNSYKSFYRGVHINFWRSFFSWGLINTSYEIYYSMFNKNVYLSMQSRGNS